MPTNQRRLAWAHATVSDVKQESPTARTLILDVPGWIDHQPGQHVDVRLTAPDGYQANRSYSISSAPGEPPQITVERVPDGEVSPYMVDVVEVGDTFEVRGPIGGYFVWEPKPAELVLIGGGSGIAPLRSMWRAAPAPELVTILYSARDAERLIYRRELDTFDGRTHIHLTRATDPQYRSGRVTGADLEVAIVDRESDIFVCGPTAFVESIATDLAALVGDPRQIKTERFG